MARARKLTLPLGAKSSITAFLVGHHHCRKKLIVTFLSAYEGGGGDPDPGHQLLQLRSSPTPAPSSSLLEVSVSFGVFTTF
jgi:hypothetical protein